MFTNIISYIFLRITYFFINLLPLRVAFAFGSFLGWFGFRILRVRRKVVMANIRQAFGGVKSEAEIDKIAALTYRNLCWNTVEFMRLSKWKQYDIDRMSVWDGYENMENAFKPGNGVIMVTCHIGNWEMFAASCTQKMNIPMNVIAKKQHNPYAEKFIMRTRTDQGLVVVYMRSSIREFFRVLKKNACLGFLCDQDARRHGEFIDFFGKPASTFKGPAIMHLRTKAPIVPAYSYRDENNIHHCIVEPVLDIDLVDDHDENIRRITRAINKRMEAWITKHPDQYFWFHKRWKSKPSGNTENA
jgi:Kdo2-lipid IVA lauroyltransferase/acyltransferase